MSPSNVFRFWGMNHNCVSLRYFMCTGASKTTSESTSMLLPVTARENSMALRMLNTTGRGLLRKVALSFDMRITSS